MVTVVLDVVCAVGVVGTALVTGMADVAHEGSRVGARRWGRPPVGRGRRAGLSRPARGVRATDPCPGDRGRGDGA
ncbi:hypothetical protein ACFVT2_35800 [Streptomyces sp. NPDC058000]|uniref:hypothetical protein n=1 Tax=Streptomyces sp. NPDC058000 TaxID=3346299 RepID=UPI0036E423D3